MAQIKTNLLYGTTGALPAVSAANLTSIPAANLTGTLPALNASALTNLDATDLSGTLPALNASALTTINASNISSGTLNAARYTAGGITEADQWRIDNGTAGDFEPLTAWERVDTDGGDKMGTGMSHSSGIFTFPSTGYWWISFTAVLISNVDSRLNYCDINTTLDNSSYSIASQANGGVHALESSHGYASVTTDFLFDVTNTTNCKCTFSIRASDNAVLHEGNSSYNVTSAFFMRLGDT